MADLHCSRPPGYTLKLDAIILWRAMSSGKCMVTEEMLKFSMVFEDAAGSKTDYWLGHQQMYDLERFYGTKVGFYKGTDSYKSYKLRIFRYGWCPNFRTHVRLKTNKTQLFKDWKNCFQSAAILWNDSMKPKLDKAQNFHNMKEDHWHLKPLLRYSNLKIGPLP